MRRCTNVNICGHVGVSLIRNSGIGDLNIIGASSNSLKITNVGMGRIAISGQVNLRKLLTAGGAQTFVYWVNSDTLMVNANQSAIVGLAGHARNLNVQLAGRSKFYGKSLCGDLANARTMDMSHANVRGCHRGFLMAQDYSSIYYFGPPANLSRFNKGHGMVLLMERAT